MLAETENEELLKLLSQVRLVTDEEAEADEQQQGQHQGEQPFNCSRYAPHSSPPSALSMSTPSAVGTTEPFATTTLGSLTKALSPVSAGRYTASSTTAAPVGWTVQDSSNIQGDGLQNRLYDPDATAAGRTPATGVKVLQHHSGDVFAEDADDGLHQPKQLFCMDTHKRNALLRQQQQQQQQQQQPGLQSPPFTPQNSVAGIIVAPAVTRSITSFSPSSSIKSGDGGGVGRWSANNPTTTAVTLSQPAVESVNAALLNIHDSCTSEGVMGARVDPSSSPPRVVSREAIGFSGNGDIMSTVLSSYAQSLHRQRQRETRAEMEAEKLADAQLDGLSRIAMEFERAADEDAGTDGSCGAVGVVTGMGVSTEVWTPERGSSGAPHALLNSSVRSPFTHMPPPQLQCTSDKAPSYSTSSIASSPLFAAAAAASATVKTSSYADPTSARAAGWGNSVSTTPLHALPSTIARQLQPQHVAAPSPVPAETAVVSFLRIGSAAPEVGGCGGTNGSPTPLSASQSSHFGGALGNEAAWRVSVEAELNELQRGVRASEMVATTTTGMNPDGSGSGLQKSATPTTTISPLAPASATPYHQLLSQLRYSPQQGSGVGGGGGGVARANTPPDRRAFFATTQQNNALMQPAASDVVRESGTDIVGSAGAVYTGGTARYTAHVTSVSPFAEVHEAGYGSVSSQQSMPAKSCWPQASPPPADAAVLWDRMSPYEKAAAAAAAGSASPSTALFRTPDTVAKPVTLSSIASRLHGGDVGSPDDLAYFAGSNSVPQRQPQQQQQQQLYPSPPAFTTAAGASPASRPQHHSSSIRLSDVGGASGPTPSRLFPSSQPTAMTMMTKAAMAPSGSPAGPGQPQAWMKQAAPQRTSAMTTPAATISALQRAGRTLPQPQPFSSPPALPRGSPDETVAHSPAANNSPPSCSLRPSPQTRASNGGSPALRRYIITTPNTRLSAAAGNTTTHAPATHSSNRRSGGGGGSPLTSCGAGNSNSNAAAAAMREARPRVQLSHAQGAAALRSPLNAASSSSGVSAAYAASPAMAGSTTSGMTPPYHSHGSSPSGNSSATTFGTGAATSVSPAAVRALIERLQAAAPLVLSGNPTSTTTTTTTTAVAADVVSGVVGGDSGARRSPLGASTGSNSSSGGNASVPEVASAAAVLAMSHDQHGCRLLQAVLDVECDGADSEGVDGDSSTTTTTAAADAAAEGLNEKTSSGGAAGGDVERRRQRRATAFYRSTAVQVILRAIEPKLDAVMADGYGNFLLQKVFDMAPDAERQRLLRLPSLQHHLCEVACSPHGTFAVQRLVETVRNTEEERLVFVALERDLLRLLTIANGGHVLMKVMECIRRQYTTLAATSSMNENANGTTTINNSNNNDTGCGSGAALRSLLQDRVDALFTAIQQNLLVVCQHKQGCCIVQKCLDFLNACSGLSPNISAASTSAGATMTTSTALQLGHREEDNKQDGSGQKNMDYFDRMSALLVPHVQELSAHPFGNYVITRLVDVCYARGSTGTIDAIAAAMQQDLVHMCTNKFASNVVEHILHHCSERRIRSICQALMTPVTTTATAAMLVSGPLATVSPAVAPLPLTTVVMDSYGNYVIQTLLTVAPVDELDSATSAEGGMLPVLQQLLPLLSSRNFGRKLETKIDVALMRVEQYHQPHQQRRRA